MREKLETLSLSVLRDFAKDKKIKNISTMRKAELIDAIINASEQEKQETQEEAAESQTVSTGRHSDKTESDSTVKGEHTEKADNRGDESRNDARPQRPLEMADGILEVLQEGYGFIRCENFLPGDNDVYVSPSQIRKFNLKTGDIVRGPKRPKDKNEKFSALMYLESVNGFDPAAAVRRPSFESLTPVFPNERLHLEKNSNTVAMRMVDLISPIGKGQRGMIVSPPKAGKTTLLKCLCNILDFQGSVFINNKNITIPKPASTLNFLAAIGLSGTFFTFLFVFL